MNFSDILQQKIETIENAQQQLREALITAEFHVESMTDAINNIIPDVESLEDDPEVLRREFISVLAQIPQVVKSSWAGPSQQIQALDQEVLRWKEMLDMYLKWEEQQEAAAEAAAQQEAEKQVAQQQLEEKVSAGEITEPSKRTAMRRQPGTKPPITLGNFRKISSQLESGEDSEG